MKTRQEGFTLIEVLISIALIATIGCAVLGALMTATRVTISNNERTMAESLAQAQMEDIMRSTYDDVFNPPQYSAISFPDPNYGIAITAARLDVDGDWDTSSDEGCQKITVQVSHHGNQVIILEAYKAKHD